MHNELWEDYIDHISIVRYIFLFQISLVSFRYILILLIQFSFGLNFDSKNYQFSKFNSLIRIHPDSLISFINGDKAYNSIQASDSSANGFDGNSKDSAHAWLVEQFHNPFGIRPLHKRHILGNNRNLDVTQSIISPNFTNPNISLNCLIGLAGFVEELQNSALWAFKSVKFYCLFSLTVLPFCLGVKLSQIF